MTGRAMLAAEELAKENIEARVICMSSIKPLMLMRCCKLPKRRVELSLPKNTQL
jgi:transketolase C-terminal domain/subunit